MLPFDPFFRNPHLATIAGNFWSRPELEKRWPVESQVYRTAPDVQVMVQTQRPTAQPKGEIIMIHGLEGSSESGYMRSMAYRALELGYVAHRFNMRSCGGTDHLSVSSYHAGQTADALHLLEQRRASGTPPLYLAGFSLGGNVALKLAGELGADAKDLLAGVIGVSTPIDLAASAAAIALPQNYLYQNRFLKRLKDRIRRRNLQAPEVYTLDHLPKIRTIEEFDDYYTSKIFGFGTAQNYFKTQSSNQFLERICIPALLVQAKDDPLIPFRVYDIPVFRTNPNLTLIAPDHGGHMGFIARKRPRFWVDEVVMRWIESNGNGSSFV